MKTILKNICGLAVAVSAVAVMPSCTSEAPFSSDGVGKVKMNVTVNHATTRAGLDSEYLDSIKENCRIYISNDKGVLHKWVGVDNVPDSGVSLRYGQYTAEAFAGDSVSASFDKMYFKGTESFVVGSNTTVTQVNLTCSIANVVASIDKDAADAANVSVVSAQVANTADKLVFSGDSLYKKGYFMMPEDDNSLSYSITVEDADGNSHTVDGVKENVSPAHEYVMRLQATPNEFTDGGAIISIKIDEVPLVVEDVVSIFGAPVFSWVGADSDPEKQIVNTNGTFTSKTFRAAAYGFKTLTLTADNSTLVSAMGGNEFELCTMSETGKANLVANGINITKGTAEGIDKIFIELTPAFLNALPASTDEYIINIVAEDKNGKSATGRIRIANTEDAIAYMDPIIVDEVAFENDLTLTRARSVTIPVSITDESIENPTLQYRAVGSPTWESKSLSATRSASKSVILSGLTPATKYEYRVVAGVKTDGKYEFESAVMNFETESIFQIPNSSFEDWSTYEVKTMLGATKKVSLPGDTGNKLTSFWGSGNEGGATANLTLTDKSIDMRHSGEYSVRLASNKAMGIIAAGNIFIGHFVGIEDTTNGVLSLGREYNGSHPTKVKVYANYRPGGSVIADSKDSHVEITEGGTDHGQIYIALTDEPIEIHTSSKKLKLFDPNDTHVLAYGQVTWKEAFGPDGQLQMLEIPFEYNNRAKSKRPTHLVIVASASKFGDYFCGSASSVMYLDDFELVYE